MFCDDRFYHIEPSTHGVEINGWIVSAIMAGIVAMLAQFAQTQFWTGTIATGIVFIGTNLFIGFCEIRLKTLCLVFGLIIAGVAFIFSGEILLAIGAGIVTRLFWFVSLSLILWLFDEDCITFTG